MVMNMEQNKMSIRINSLIMRLFFTVVSILAFPLLVCANDEAIDLTLLSLQSNGKYGYTTVSGFVVEVNKSVAISDGTAVFTSPCEISVTAPSGKGISQIVLGNYVTNGAVINNSTYNGLISNSTDRKSVV